MSEMDIIHHMHVLYPQMHHMHGGIYIRREDKREISSYVLNQVINNNNPSYLIGNVSRLLKLKSRVQSHPYNNNNRIFVSLSLSRTSRVATHFHTYHVKCNIFGLISHI